MKTNEGKGIYPLDFMYEQAGLLTYCCELSHAKQLERRSLKKSPNFFFRLLLSNCLNWRIYCDDHSSLSSTTAVQK